MFFPWLVKYNIGSLNKINTKNSDEVVKVIKNYLDKAEDKDSVYQKVLFSESLPKE